MTTRWPPPLVVEREQLESVLTPAAVVEAIEKSYRGLAAHGALMPAPMGFDLDGGSVHVKGAQIAGGSLLGALLLGTFAVPALGWFGAGLVAAALVVFATRLRRVT